MGNILKHQKEISKNLDQITQSQIQNTSNILIKESKEGNVDIIKLNLQIINAEIIYDSVDKIQLDLTISSHVNFQMIVHTFVTETKGAKQQRYEKSMPSSITQSFKCPSGQNYQFPSRYIEFMIIDLLRFKKIRINPDAQYHSLIIEMRCLNSKSFQIIYFYHIDCNEQSYQCELINTKQILIHESRFFEIQELYGVQNTLFNPQWNPNTIQDKECVICFYNMINTVLLPCKHMCACSDCADHILMNQKFKQCPLCRIDINNYLALEIKDKQKQELLQKQYKEEQQKYLESIKEKKEQQIIKQSLIQEQLKSKLKEEQLTLQKKQIKNMRYFNDLDDFIQDNSQNENIKDNQSFCSCDQNLNVDNNQFKNQMKDKKQQNNIEHDNNLRLSQQNDEEIQKSTANQKSPCDREFLNSYQQQQDIKYSIQNNINQTISFENDISQDLSHQHQQYLVLSKILKTNNSQNQNNQLNTRYQDQSIKQQKMQQDENQLKVNKKKNKRDSSNYNQILTKLKKLEYLNLQQQIQQSKQKNNRISLSQLEIQQKSQQFQQNKSQQWPLNFNSPLYNSLKENNLIQSQNEFKNLNHFQLKTCKSQISNQDDCQKTIKQYEYLKNDLRLNQDNCIQKSASLIDFLNQNEDKKDLSNSKEIKNNQISLIVFD